MAKITTDAHLFFDAGRVGSTMGKWLGKQLGRSLRHPRPAETQGANFPFPTMLLLHTEYRAANLFKSSESASIHAIHYLPLSPSG